MLRFETSDGGKSFRPLTYCEIERSDGAWRYQAFPKPFPLYGLNRLAHRKDAPVLVTEGEKAADGAQELLPDMVAVSWPHGARSVKDADWSPVAERVIYVWPDADEEGQRAAEEVCRRCTDAGAKSVLLITPPSGVSKGWDGANALKAGYTREQVAQLIDDATPFEPIPEFRSEEVVNLSNWRADRFAGPPPERRWLIAGILPLATPTMVAAQGGIGKSMIMFRMSLDVATGDLQEIGHEEVEPILGGKVSCHGSAVLVTAEDDAAEIHRRLAALDPNELRLRNPKRLTVVPLPNAGGILTLLRGGFDRPQVTEECEDLYRQLLAIPDLKLIVFDPLQAFVGADVNKDPAAGQYLCTFLGRLAAQTGATVVVTHHFRKGARIKGPADARDAVRGTTALIDGVRCVYAFWSADERYGRKVCAQLGMKFRADTVVRGAVVKANWPFDPTVQTYVRNELGLLCDHTHRLGQPEDREHLLAQLERAIEQAAAKGMPYTKSGRNGVYERRDELPPDLRRIGRNRLQQLVQELLDNDRARQCAARGSRTVQWLDVPGGSFSLGEGEFVCGALKARR